VTGSLERAAQHLVAPAGPLGELDLSPRPGALGGAPVDASVVKDLEDWNLDFNGAQRTGVRRGAYAGRPGQGGWRLARTRKEMAKLATEAKPPAEPAKGPAPEKKPPAPPRRPVELTEEQVCRGLWSLAMNYRRAGMKDKAREYLRKIIDEHPDSEYAARARRELGGR
jgi:hypothetical protein